MQPGVLFKNQPLKALLNRNRDLLWLKWICETNSAKKIETLIKVQSLWSCRAGVDNVEITGKARESGVVVTPLSLHYRQSPQRHGLILGYTALERPALLAELKTLRQIFIDLTTKH